VFGEGAVVGVVAEDGSQRGVEADGEHIGEGKVVPVEIRC